MAENRYDSLALLQILIAAFLIVTGLQQIIYFNSTSGGMSRFFSNMFGNSEYIFNLVIGILELASGVIILITALGITGSKSILMLAVLIFLIIRLIFNDFIRQNIFSGDILEALGVLLRQLIIISGVWIGYNKN